jgi:hypothetical protein
MIATAIGPWRPDLDPAERTARFRCMRTIARLLLGPHHPLVPLLAQAEGDPVAAVQAFQAMELLPTKTRRHVWAAFADLHRPGAA